MAVVVALLLPAGHPNIKVFCGICVVFSAVVALVGSEYTRFFMRYKGETALFAPIDVGPLWYVRQLIIGQFLPCLDVLCTQLATLLTIVLAWGLPDFKGTSERVKSFVPFFKDSNTCLAVFAVSFSYLTRTELTYSNMSYVCLLFYCFINLLATKDVVTESGVVRRLAHKRVRPLFVIYGYIFTITFNIAFFVPNLANFNWLFFSQTGVAVISAVFVLQCVYEVVNDVLAFEKECEQSL
ncbi:hypothetical protein AGDE_10831 [Angomonas deanei]|nr:hypothetical protein AGDE_10831 [Angomonas deanei]|eukprot:EPY27307.1 hypothetical protein AGDE_10831 [Angomonas deanei]